MNPSSFKQDGYNTIDLLNKGISRILFIAVIAEIIVFPQWENIVGCFVMIYGWVLVSKYIATYNNLRLYPLPVIAILCYGFCYHVLPLVVTLIELKPLTFNFQVPYLTFFNHFLFITTITGAFGVCTRIYNQNNILNQLWNKIGYISEPSDLEIWIWGWIGLLCVILRLSSQGVYVEAQATGNTFNIVINTLSTLSVAPVCLAYKHFYSKNPVSNSSRLIKYYILFLMVIGIASTRRMLIFNSFATLGLLYLFNRLYNNKELFSRKFVVIGVIAFYLITGPIADLATAMILNRQSVNTESASSTFNTVLALYNDKETLHRMHQIVMDETDNNGDNRVGWSEYYVDNIFLDRFCNLRVMDATLYNAQNVGYATEAALEYYKDYWVNQLPSSIANAFGLKKVVHGTVCDEMLIGIFGDSRYSIAGSKVGGATGIGLYCFGYWFYLVAFVTYIIAFYFMCSFVNIFDKRIQFPVVILATFMKICTYFNNANGIFFNMDIFTRVTINTILIYSIIMFLLKIFFRR